MRPQAAPGFDSYGLAADRIRRSRFDYRRGDTASQSIPKSLIGGVNRVDCPESGAVRIGGFVRVVTRPAMSLFVDADVSMCLHKTG